MADSSFPVPPTAVGVPVLALMSLILDIPPLAWHIKNRNLAASSLVFWIILSNLMNVVNPFIWPTDDIENWWNGSGLCDVEVKLMIAVTFGVVGSLACIMRSLAQVLDTERTVLNPSSAERHWKMATNLLLCFGGPFYSMVIHYVVQPNRYYIFAISGCTTSYDNSWPKFALILIWPPILCLVAVYYSVLVIVRMHKYRKAFSEVLGSTRSNMTKSRFLRLFILSITLITAVFPTQYYVLYRNVVPLLPYSWDAVHGPDWNQIELIPTGGTVVFDRWIQIGIGFAIFPFFGLGQDAQKMYRQALLKIGFGRIFPCLRRHPPARPQRHSSPISPSGSLSSRARMFFHKRKSEGSMFSLHSQSVSTPVSGASMSPFEAQRGFDSLPTISEADSRHRTSQNSPPSNSIPERLSLPQQSSKRESWLERFGVKVHSPAAIRQERAAPGSSRIPNALQFGGSPSARSADVVDLEKGDLAEFPSKEVPSFASYKKVER